jgi:hypothetical protein
MSTTMPSASFALAQSTSTPLHRYITAFNARDRQGMAAVFSPHLQTIHPAEPEVDVTSAEPFLQRMESLWPRGLRYILRRVMTSGDPNGDGEVWGELIAADAGGVPLAAEVVLYTVASGLVTQICVYKQLHPTHPAYQL